MNVSTRTPPKRLQVLLALRDLLGGIRVAEGAAFDVMPDAVHVNRLLFGQDVINQSYGGVTLSIVEAPRPDFAQFAGENNIESVDKWTLMIQGITPDDKSPDTEHLPYYLVQDVQRRMRRIMEVKEGSGSKRYPEHYMLGGKITTVEFAPPVVRPPEMQVSSHAFFYLPIRLGIAVEIGE